MARNRETVRAARRAAEELREMFADEMVRVSIKVRPSEYYILVESLVERELPESLHDTKIQFNIVEELSRKKT